MPPRRLVAVNELCNLGAQARVPFGEQGQNVGSGEWASPSTAHDFPGLDHETRLF